VIRELRKVKDSYNCDAVSIVGAMAAIDDQDWLCETRGRIVATRSRMSDSLVEMGFDVTPSQANFVWCTHREAAVESLYRQLKEAGVLVRYMLYPNWGDGLRITVGTDEQVDACLALLKGMV
jgi:histidinol-phosphate aminotransferase